MDSKYLLKTLYFSILIGILLVACGPSSEEIATLTASSWTATPTKTYTPVPTATTPPTETPTPTSTPTNTPLPPTATPTATETPETLPTLAEGEEQTFQYKDQEFHISGAYLDETYSTTLERARPDFEDPIAASIDGKQLAGTNCLYLAISNSGWDQAEALESIVMFQQTGSDPTGRLGPLIELTESILVDENGTETQRTQDVMSFTIKPEGDLILFIIFYPPKEATSFILILPDGQKIPLILFE